MGELPLLAGQQPIAEIWSRISQAAVTMWPKATEQKNPYPPDKETGTLMLEKRRGLEDVHTRWSGPDSG